MLDDNGDVTETKTITADEGSNGLIFTLPTGDKLTITSTAGGVRDVSDNQQDNHTFSYVIDNQDFYTNVTTEYGELSITPINVFYFTLLWFVPVILVTLAANRR